MSEDLKLASATTTSSCGECTPKKRSGCGCVVVGCLVVIGVIVLTLGGLAAYFSSLNEADFGKILVSVMKNKDFSNGLKNGFESNANLTKEQKQVFSGFFDAFTARYDNLNVDQQQIINKNIFVILKKLFTEPENFGKEPPAEFTEMLKLLNVSTLVVPKQTLVIPPSNTTATDPYGFDIQPTNPANQNNTTTSNPTTPATQGQYDF